jgi:hypothetical protein
MKAETRRKLNIILLIIAIILSIYVLLIDDGNSHKVIVSGKKETTSPSTLSIMLETSANSGSYEVTSNSTWPTNMDFNESLSKCENGSTLSWDDTNKKVVFQGNISDNCYIYFEYPRTKTATIKANVTNLPTTYGYTTTPYCTGSTSTWNQGLQQLEISAISATSSTCTLSFASPTSTTALNTYIIGLKGTTQGDGQVVYENSHEYRYEGKNPNNYVMFNNELWRIIGVFDSNSHGVSNTNLVKLIRANSIGGLAWDKSNTNNWINSSLKALLNGAYYNATTDTENCYGYLTTATTICDYREIGIQSGYREMIQSVTWYLGGGGASGYKTYDPASIYGYERNSSAIYSGRSASTTGYIGLMYESDYLYGVLSSSCARTTTHYTYNTAACGGSDWLYGQGYEWTISPGSDTSYCVWNVNNSGKVTSSSAANGFPVRPVLYLKSSVYKISGTGTISDPYIIGM